MASPLHARLRRRGFTHALEVERGGPLLRPLFAQLMQLAVVAAVLGLALATPFADWMEENGKEYSSLEERSYRESVFTVNTRRIADLNSNAEYGHASCHLTVLTIAEPTATMSSLV